MKATLDRLDQLVRLPRNPKSHDLGGLHESYEEFGFLERVVINDETGRMVAGHGRINALQQRKAAGKAPPDNVEVASDGMWLVPTDHVQIDEQKEEAAALALNRIAELGGWDEVMLAEVLADIAAQDSLRGTGFDEDDLDVILSDLSYELDTTYEPEESANKGLHEMKFMLLPDQQEKVESVLTAIVDRGVEYPGNPDDLSNALHYLACEYHDA